MREAAKSMSALVFLLYYVFLVFFTEMANKMLIFWNRAFFHFIRLCAIFKFVDWFTINKIMLLTSNKYSLFLPPTNCKCNILV